MENIFSAGLSLFDLDFLSLILSFLMLRLVLWRIALLLSRVSSPVGLLAIVYHQAMGYLQAPVPTSSAAIAYPQHFEQLLVSYLTSQPPQYLALTNHWRTPLLMSLLESPLVRK